MGKYIINNIVKIMERNQSSYKPCKMYMLSGNCLNKCECPFNHLAPKVTQEKKKLQLRNSQPFSMDFHPTGSQKNIEKTENIITEKKPEPQAFKAPGSVPQFQNNQAQPRQNQNAQGLVNNNNQINLNQLDPKTRQEVMNNIQMQQYQQMLMLQQMQNQQNQFKGNNFGMNMQQNMMNQLGAMNMGQFGGMNQGQAMNQFQNNLQNMEQIMNMMEAEGESDDEYDDEEFVEECKHYECCNGFPYMCANSDFCRQMEQCFCIMQMETEQNIKEEDGAYREDLKNCECCRGYYLKCNGDICAHLGVCHCVAAEENNC